MHGRLTKLHNDLLRRLEKCYVTGSGVATDGKCTYIVGGKTHPASNASQQLLLADVFQYHAEENCWMQVASCTVAWLFTRRLFNVSFLFE